MTQRNPVKQTRACMHSLPPLLLLLLLLLVFVRDQPMRDVACLSLRVPVRLEP